MLIDRPQITESSTIVNATVASGSLDPANPSVGELFYRTDLGSIRVYSGTAWADAGAAGVATHIADATRHLTPAQNTLLDSLTVGATEINLLAGTTANINTRIGAIEGVNTAQATSITNLTSSQGTTGSGLSTHIADAVLHLSAYQNTLLDTVESSSPPTAAVFAADLLKMAGASTATILSGVSLSSALATMNGAGAPALKFNAAGGTVGGNVTINGTLSMNSTRITTLAAPTVGSDAATKDYVDSLSQGLSWKASVRAATTANIALSGAQTLDGVVLAQGDRVLVKNQTATSQNGIYLVATGGAWSRDQDANSAVEITGMAVFVRLGTAHGTTAWIQTGTVTTLGTDPIVYSQFAAAGGTLAGAGITVSGTNNSTTSVNAGAGLSFSGGALVVNPTARLSTATAQLDLAPSGVTAATYGSATLVPVITVDAFGRTTSVTTTTIAPSFASITAKPTTLAGYGITDAQGGGSAVPIAGGVTMTGNLSWTAGTTILAAAPAASSAYFSTAAYGVSQGDGRTHFGFNQAGTFVNFVRGAQTTISGNLTVDGSITGSGSGLSGTATNLNIGGAAATVTTITSAQVTTALGFTPYSAANPAGYTSSAGTVTSVAGTGTRSGLTLTGTVTTSGSLTLGGTLAVTPADFSSQSANTFLAAPTGAAGVPTFRAIVVADIPVLNQNTTGSAATLTTGRSFSISGDATGTTSAAFTGAADASIFLTLSSVNFNEQTNAFRKISTDTKGRVTATAAVASIDITTALGYVPYNGTNPAGYISSGALSAYGALGLAQTWTSNQEFRSTANTSVAVSSGTLQPTALDSSVGATMSFHRPSLFGLNMGLDSDNIFRIGGWSAAANRLQMNMDGDLTMAGNVTAFSDRRLKTDIVKISDALYKVEQIEGVTFKRIDSGAVGTGVIAQDVQSVLPEAVMTHDDGTLSVAYGNLVGLLIEAVKDLNRELQAIKAQVAAKG